MRVSPDLTRIGGETRSGRALFAVPLALILAVTLSDLTAPPSVHLGPFLIAAPAITASFAGAGGTAVIGALAVAAQIVIGALHGGLMTANHQAQLVALIAISGLVTSFRYVTDRHRRRLGQVRSVAVAAQEVLLRPLPERIGELRIASLYLAADEEAQIGGDLYAAVRTEGATRLVIGDVRGKGLAAIGDAAVLIGAFRGSAYRNLSLPGIAAHMGNAMCWNWYHLGGEERYFLESFVTAVVLDIYDDGPVTGMVNCGHPHHCCCTRAWSRRWRWASPRCRWAWRCRARGTTRWRCSASSTATFLCCTPTGSTRPGTRAAPSIRSPNGSRGGRAAARSRWWIFSTPICSGTPAGSSTTTRPSW
ncbi:hypothetical protein SVIO_082610 [Streptomyces violaceusniger]|uniref:PPM-type phosphatase domain-containing protein n=1 Tax=Streptomyces violaceusniger TaxID=68280 RepID=A0A4D4LGL9_STRVO|nr:hypothetical protein SVIO_082610 [Streptomyces violaceusniger]